MMHTPAEVAQHLNLIAQLKALDGANRFSITAYQDAAQKIEKLTRPEQLVDVRNLNLGAKTSKAVKQFAQTGTSDAYEELATRLPVECLTMTAVAGIGPKTALSLWNDGIHHIGELIVAAENGQLKPKMAKAVLFQRDVGSGRIPRQNAAPVASAMIEAIRKIPGIVHAEICGSYRRGRDTMKDLDIVAAVQAAKDVSGMLGSADKLARALKTNLVFGTIADALQEAAILDEVLNDGIVKREFRVRKYGTIIKSDVWVVDVSYWGSALNYATGSKFHNIALREKAAELGMKVNEYGIWDVQSGKRLGGEDEHDLYDLLGVEYVEPTEREN
jgi:DNA polymerase (family 10)